MFKKLALSIFFIILLPLASFAEDGLASWYGEPYHGQKAADGSIYNMYEMTAAHRTLPFGTIVKVINKKNNKTVKLRITDRGPFVEKRIIDVSFTAAQKLDMINSGLAPVSVEIIER